MQTSVFLGLAIILLLGCAPAAKSPPTFADRLERERKELAAISEKWSHGQALVKQGEAAIRAGDQLIEQGQKQRAQGETMIQQGQRLMEEAEQAYQMRTSSGVATFPLDYDSSPGERESEHVAK